MTVPYLIKTAIDALTEIVTICTADRELGERELRIKISFVAQRALGKMGGS